MARTKQGRGGGPVRRGSRLDGPARRAHGVPVSRPLALVHRLSGLALAAFLYELIQEATE